MPHHPNIGLSVRADTSLLAGDAGDSRSIELGGAIYRQNIVMMRTCAGRLLRSQALANDVAHQSFVRYLRLLDADTRADAVSDSSRIDLRQILSVVGEGRWGSRWAS